MVKTQGRVRLFLLGRLVVAAALVVLWALLAGSTVVNAYAIAGPDAVVRQIGDWIGDGSIWGNIASTMQVLALGYGAGVLVGVVAGVAVGVSPTFRLYAEPFLVFFNAVPRLVLIPFFIVWLGFGPAPRIITVFLVIVFVIAITVQTSVQEIPEEYISNATALGARKIDLARDVYAPAIAIWVVASARIAIGLAFQAAVVSEFFGASSGLGQLIIHGSQTFDANEIYAAITLTVILALAIDLALARVDRHVRRWLPSTAAAA